MRNYALPTEDTDMNTKTTRITHEQVEGQMAFCQKIHAYWTERGITPKA